jgi:bifunctional ADP-heptose synthase (sugar kinase/adenylyltransferase)
MIVPTHGLEDLRGVVTMVDGGFDPLHDGHVAYFAAAAELGHPVLCNVSGDEYVSTKHPPLLAEDKRARVIDSIRHIAYVHVSHTTTADVLRDLRPKVYAKGADWRDRLPSAEVAICSELGIEIAYLDTVTDSSTRLLEAFRSQAKEQR